MRTPGRSGNSDHPKLEARLIREIPRDKRLQGVAPVDQDPIIGRLLLETVVLDVEGLEEDGGAMLGYTMSVSRFWYLPTSWGRRAFPALAADSMMLFDSVAMRHALPKAAIR